MREGARRAGTIMASLRPVIAICGTTGVGKSKLAVELALRIAEGAAVINADSMQVYDGLDILTNKIPREEMKGVPHLLMGFKEPGEQYVVGQWVEEAAKAVSLVPDLLSGHLIPQSHNIQDQRHSQSEQDPNRRGRHLLLDTTFDLSRSFGWEGFSAIFPSSLAEEFVTKTFSRRERPIRQTPRCAAVRFG